MSLNIVQSVGHKRIKLLWKKEPVKELQQKMNNEQLWCTRRTQPVLKLRQEPKVYIVATPTGLPQIRPDNFRMADLSGC
jgi:hypothetical protein